jgi:hypothetical protein
VPEHVEGRYRGTKPLISRLVAIGRQALKKKKLDKKLKKN